VIGWLRRLFCQHPAMMRCHVNGVPWFGCPTCGHVAPIVRRHQPVVLDKPAHERMTARKVQP